MIKINIKDKETKEELFFDAMKVPFLARMNFLRLSINHIMDKSEEIVNNGIGTYKIFTAKIIELAEDKKIGDDVDYNAPNYLQTIADYLATDNNLSGLKLDSLLKLLDDLKADENAFLREFLICPPENLLAMIEKIKTKYDLTEKETEIFCLVTDYGAEKPSDAAKKFFREQNIVEHCPYCNLIEVQYLPPVYEVIEDVNDLEDADPQSEGDGGNLESDKPITFKSIASVHDLDHFFSQTDFPMLSLCMYNLIPCCSTCNRLNKLKVCFSDEWHLNPYIRGFNGDAKFVPKREELVVDHVIIELFCEDGSEIYKKINGIKGDNTKEGREKGNINVFELRGKYHKRKHVAEKILKLVHKRETGWRSHLRFLPSIGPFDHAKAHKEWFKLEIRTDFEPDKFGDNIMSKFNRDMHDYYFSDKHGSKYDLIHQLITEMS